MVTKINMNNFQMKKTVEAALFLAGKKLTLNELCSILETNPKEIEKIIKELQKEYSSRDTSIEILDEAGSYKMSIKSDYLDKVRTLAPQMDMNRAVIMTLSYIAYKQPIKQSELVKKFGNRIYEYVTELTNRGLIRAEKSGRTKMLTTTKKLLAYLGESDLKKIRESLDKAKIERKRMDEAEKKELEEMYKLRKIKRKIKEKPKMDLSVEDWVASIKKEKEDTLEKQISLYEKRVEREGKKFEEDAE